MRRGAEIDVHGAHGKGDTVLHQLEMMHPALAQELGPRPLEEVQIRRMVDIAGKVRVLVVDADGERMAAHSASASGSSNRLACRPTKPCGTLLPRCWKASAVSRRPRGVRWMKPCWIR